MTVDILYELNRNDGSENEIYLMETELNEKEEILYKEAYENGTPFNDVEELKEAAMREYKYVARALTYQELELGDEYVTEVLEKDTIDPDKLNDLVHGRDPLALEFFGFENMTDEKLAEWDSHALELMPPAYFFDDTLKGPFDLKWSLECRFVEKEEMSEE